MPEQLTSNHFRPALGESIPVAGGPPIVLREIELHPHQGGPRPEPFSLVFAGPSAPLLAQGTYTLAIPTLGDIEVFLVPIGPGADGMRYEAVFN